MKIVKNVPTNDYLKSRTKAMKIAAGIPGTISIALVGRHKDQLVVVGDGVDAVELTRQLRKKMEYTQLISDEEVHENIEKKDEGGVRRKTREVVAARRRTSQTIVGRRIDKEGGGRAAKKNDKASGELRKMGANKVYGCWFMYGPGTCVEAVLDEPKQEEWLLTVAHSVRMPSNIAAGAGTVTIHLC